MAMPAPEWPNVDGLSDAECALFMRGYRLGLIAGEENAQARQDEAGARGLLDCDWEHGVCCCPGCGAVVQVVNRQGRPAKVVDADGREHFCQRQVAAVLHAHGAPGMLPLLQHHAARRPLVTPPPEPAAAPSPLGIDPLSL